MVRFQQNLTISVGVPLAAEDAVLPSDVISTQDNILPTLRIGFAHPVNTETRSLTSWPART